MDDSVVVTRNDAASRFEITVDGELAGFAAIRSSADHVVFTHTEIDHAYEGRGLGSVLARGALDAVRAAGQLVVPLCPFIARFIEHHHEYADLVDAAAYARMRAAPHQAQQPQQ